MITTDENLNDLLIETLPAAAEVLPEPESDVSLSMPQLLFSIREKHKDNYPQVIVKLAGDVEELNMLRHVVAKQNKQIAALRKTIKERSKKRKK